MKGFKPIYYYFRVVETMNLILILSHKKSQGAMEEGKRVAS
jgi:hypothetical protein